MDSNFTTLINEAAALLMLGTISPSTAYTGNSTLTRCAASSRTESDSETISSDSESPCPLKSSKVTLDFEFHRQAYLDEEALGAWEKSPIALFREALPSIACLRDLEQSNTFTDEQKTAHGAFLSSTLAKVVHGSVLMENEHPQASSYAKSYQAAKNVCATIFSRLESISESRPILPYVHRNEKYVGAVVSGVSAQDVTSAKEVNALGLPLRRTHCHNERQLERHLFRRPSSRAEQAIADERLSEEIKHHAEALQYVLSELAWSNEPLTRETLQRAHYILTHGEFYGERAQDNAVGGRGLSAYRTKDVESGLPYYAFGKDSLLEHHVEKADYVILAMDSFVRYYNKTIEELFRTKRGDPFSLASKFCHRLLAIQPFANKNGPMSRLMLNAILVKLTGFAVPIMEDRGGLMSPSWTFAEHIDTKPWAVLNGFVLEKYVRHLRKHRDQIGIKLDRDGDGFEVFSEDESEDEAYADGEVEDSDCTVDQSEEIDASEDPAIENESREDDGDKVSAPGQVRSSTTRKRKAAPTRSRPRKVQKVKKPKSPPRQAKQTTASRSPQTTKKRRGSKIDKNGCASTDSGLDTERRTSRRTSKPSSKLRKVHCDGEQGEGNRWAAQGPRMS